MSEPGPRDRIHSRSGRGDEPITLSRQTYDVLAAWPRSWTFAGDAIVRVAAALDRSRLSIARSVAHLESLELVQNALVATRAGGERPILMTRRVPDGGN